MTASTSRIRRHSRQPRRPRARSRQPRCRVGLQGGTDGESGTARDDTVEGRPGARTWQVDGHVRDDPTRSCRQDHDTVGQEDRLGDAVGDDDDGRAQTLPEAQQLRVEPVTCQRVERTEGLVQQQHPGIQGQGPGKGDPLGHATR